MPWSFPGIDEPVECVYTQHTGFDADVAQLTCNPQSGLPTAGTLSLTWGATTITLPNCTVDLGSVQLKSNVKHMVLMVKDRRALWERVLPISGEYNVTRVGAYPAAAKKNLRELGTILMTALGEGSANVSILPTTIYPPVSWLCDDVVKVAQALLEAHGYSVTLGYGAEVVTVVQLGTGATLSTTGRFIGSETLDPKLRPRYVVNCFKPSVAQVRLKLEAVGVENGVWVPIDSLSYKPAGGWGAVPPVTLPQLRGVATASQQAEAAGYVRRAYRVSGFADSTWNIPDGSGSVTGLSDILPLMNQVLDLEDIRPDNSYQPFRVYGKHFITEEDTDIPHIPGGLTTLTYDRMNHVDCHFDGENGILIFRKPKYYISGGAYLPADLWLECTIRIRNQTNFAWRHYVKTNEIDATGIGYVAYKHESRAESIVNYLTNYNVDTIDTNQTALDADAAAASAVILLGYGTTAGQFEVYANPVLTLRCDGAIMQVQHILTCGEMAHALNRTVASSNFEFDRGIPSRGVRQVYTQSKGSASDFRQARLRVNAMEDANDG